MVRTRSHNALARPVTDVCVCFWDHKYKLDTLVCASSRFREEWEAGVEAYMDRAVRVFKNGGTMQLGWVWIRALADSLGNGLGDCSRYARSATSSVASIGVKSCGSSALSAANAPSCSRTSAAAAAMAIMRFIRPHVARPLPSRRCTKSPANQRIFQNRNTWVLTKSARETRVSTSPAERQ